MIGLIVGLFALALFIAIELGLSYVLMTVWNTWAVASFDVALMSIWVALGIIVILSFIFNSGR